MAEPLYHSDNPALMDHISHESQRFLPRLFQSNRIDLPGLRFSSLVLSRPGLSLKIQSSYFLLNYYGSR